MSELGPGRKTTIHVAAEAGAGSLVEPPIVRPVVSIVDRVIDGVGSTRRVVVFGDHDGPVEVTPERAIAAMAQALAVLCPLDGV